MKKGLRKIKSLVPLAVFIIVFLGHILYFNIFVAHSAPGWWSMYVGMQQYFISFSLALAFAYGAYALSAARGFRSAGATGMSLVIVFLVWFTTCCGAPILTAVLAGLGAGFGSVVLPPPAAALLTVVLVSLGYLYVRRKMAPVKLAPVKLAPAMLVCPSCGTQVDVPVVHCGPGIPGEDRNKLYCPCRPEGHLETMDMPSHCGIPMTYVE